MQHCTLSKISLVYAHIIDHILMFDILIQYCYGLTVPSGLPHAQLQSYVYSMQFIHPI